MNHILFTLLIINLSFSPLVLKSVDNNECKLNIRVLKSIDTRINMYYSLNESKNVLMLSDETDTEEEIDKISKEQDEYLDNIDKLEDEYEVELEKARLNCGCPNLSSEKQQTEECLVIDPRREFYSKENLAKLDQMEKQLLSITKKLDNSIFFIEIDQLNKKLQEISKIVNTTNCQAYKEEITSISFHLSVLSNNQDSGELYADSIKEIKSKIDNLDVSVNNTCKQI